MYQVIIQDKPKRFLKKLDKFEQKKILDKLEKLAINPELGKPLVSKLVGLWSLRIGIYRLLYQIKKSELLILVLKIGHRKDIYR